MSTTSGAGRGRTSRGACSSCWPTRTARTGCSAATPGSASPLERLGRLSDGGVPYLAPEVQLLYKSKSRRAKDEQDFEAALPVLDVHGRAWLAETIALVEGADHPWAARLRALLAG